MMINNIKYVIYLVVLIGFSCSNAGSYDDYFAAIAVDNDRGVSALLERGFDPNTLNEKGQHGLLLALRTPPSVKVLKLLMDQPDIKVEVRNAQDESPLMLAALHGLTDVCETLIELDAQVNKPGWAPLHYAAAGGHTGVIRLLLDHHAYIDTASPNDTTPLMMAARYGSTQAVKMLLDAGADTNVKNQLGLSAMDFAREGQRPDAVEAIAAFIRANRSKGSW